MKTILLTGATDGIGLETAKLLAEQGHHLLIHGRSDEKLQRVVSGLKTAFPGAIIDAYRADLSDFGELKSMLGAIRNDHDHLDVIINNAGIFKTSEPITADGIDVRFVVNLLAPYIITMTLLPLLGDDGRIVNLSSAAQAPINLAAMQGKQKLGEAFEAYAQSKLAITIWSQHLAQELKAGQVVVAVNPGSLLASNMVKEGFGVAGNDLGIGAQILLKASLSDSFAGASGKYFDNDQQAFSQPHADAKDEEKTDQLLQMLAALVARYYGPI